MSRAQTYDPKKRNDLLSPGTNDDSPRNSKGSFGSQDSDLSFEKYDVDAMDDSDKYNSSTKGFETRTSSNTFHEGGTAYNQEIDDFDALKNDPIFHRLCPRNQYADGSNCKVCGKGFSKIKLISKKNCKFCGECICEDHSKKKRPNPENPTEYVRVCDICDEKWINRTIMGEFYEKLKAKEKEIDILEKQIREQQMKIENEQKEHDALILMRNRNEKNYTDQINILQSEIQRVKEETRKCERENTELSKEFNHTQDKVTQLDTDISKAEDEYKKLSKEATELTYKIEAINQDIAQTNREIRTIEEYITQNKTPGIMSYADVRSRISKNGDFSGRNASEYSSVVSETLPNGKKSHYARGLRGSAAKANANVEPRSGNCDVKCNIF